jgi:hypothetical protein
MSGKVYCTKGHGLGQHHVDCIPPADPNDLELRLIRVIFGLCPDCDMTDYHEHPCTYCGASQPLPDGSYCVHDIL